MSWGKLPRLAFDLLDLAVDDGDDHRRFARAEIIGPGLDHGFADLVVAAGVDIGRAHVLDAAVARGGRAALLQQLFARDVLADDPLAAAEGFGGCGERQGQWKYGRGDG